MAILYSEYKKKYGDIINVRRESRQAYEKSQQTSKDAKEEYEKTRSSRLKTRDNLVNYYQNKGVSVSNGGILPTPLSSAVETPKLQRNENSTNSIIGPANLNNRYKAVENIKKFNEVTEQPNVQSQRNRLENQYFQEGESYLNYLNKKLEEDDIGLYDKTIGRVVAPVISRFTSTPYIMKNENGDTYSMPTYEDLKQQKVLDSYDDGFWGTVGKIGSSALYEGGKLATSAALNALMPGTGTATYFGNIYFNQWNNAVAEGYSKEQALAYATLSTATEAVTSKILGGTTNAIFGTGTSELSQSIANSLSKFIQNNPTLVNGISNAISEGGEEFVQEYVDVLTRNLTLGEDNKVFTQENFENALFSAAVGSLTGGVSGVFSPNTNINNQQENTQVNRFRQNTSTNNRYSLPTYNQNIENTVVNDAVNSRVNQNMLQNNVSAPVMNSEGNIVNPNRYVYIKSDNTNIDTLRKSASQYFNNSSETRNFLNTIEKIIGDKDYSVVFDDSIVNSKGNPVNAQISTDNGRITIKINPNSDRAGEFLIVHEVTHGIETSDMKHLVLDFASKNPEFNTALESLKQTYGINDVNSEVLADISGQLLGNQEFINSLTMQNTQQSKNIIRKIYESIRRLLNTLTENGRYRNFVQDLETKWREAYRTTTTEQTINNLNNETIYSILNNSKGKYVKADRQVISGKNPLKWEKQVENYINNQIRKGKDVNVITEDGDILTITEDTAGKAKFRNNYIDKNGQKHYLSNDEFLTKLSAEVHIDELGRISKQTNKNTVPDYKNHAFAKDGFNYRTAFFEDYNGDYYKITMSIGKNGNINTIYNVGKLEQRKRPVISGSSVNNGANGSLTANNIPQSTQNVNSSTSTRYSMQENKNNTNNYKTDSVGRTLTKQQQEYFKDSKVRDENGNLQVVYHGSPNQFTQFSYDYIGSNGTALGKGFYLTDSISMANGFTGNGNEVMELYANITKPLSLDELTINKQEFKKFVREIAKQDEYWIYDYGDIDREGFEKTLNYAVDLNYDNETNDVDLIHGILNTTTLGWENGFRVLNKTLGYDGIIKHYDAPIDQATGESNVYVPFFPEQIKNVDNSNPTSNKDIRYSQNNQTWQEYLEENYPASGTRTNMQDIRIPTSQDIQRVENNSINLPNPNRVLNPLEISQLTPEDANTTPMLPNVNRNRVNDGESRFASNIRNKTNMLNEQQKNTILADEEVNYYDAITNEDSLNEAFSRLNENGEAETLNWFSKDSESATAVDVAEGWILLKQYADNNDSDGMVAVAKKLRDMGTKAGQTVQAFNIMARMTPEGMVKYAQSELSEAYDRMVKNKTKKWIDQHQKDFDLTPQETAAIMEIMQKVSTMPDGYDKRVELAKIQKIMTDKLPPERGAGIKSWMRISMLFNPKTQVRNVAGNAIIAPVNSFSDLFASMADKVIGSKTGYRTTGVTNVRNYVKGFKEGFYQSYNDFKQGINTRNIQGNRFEIGEGKSFNNNTAIGKALNRVDSLLSFMLDAGDRTFYEATFTNSINNQLVLNNTTEVTQDMIDIATQEALSRTWQDNNNYTRFVLSVRKMLNNVNFKGYGLGDVLIPFAKTPANLTKAIVDYSPVGLVNTLVKGKRLSNAIETGQFTPQMQHDFVQSLGKAVAGTMLYVAGYALAKAGIVSGESDDDKDVQNFMKNTLGVNSYSIKIGDKSFTYDWAQPIAAPLSIMANIVQKEDENASALETVLSSLDTAGNILLEQSFMESINTALNNTSGLATGVQEAIFDLPARAIPTFMKQIADMVDGTQRTSFEYGKPLESAINSVKSKIPFLSKTLAPSVDSMGREIQKYGGNNNIFNVFFNPANVSTENISESAGEIYRLYQETSDATIMPRVPDYKYKDKDGNEVILNSSQRAEFLKISGNVIEENVGNLLDNSDYEKLSDEDKSSIIKSIVDYSYNKAREEVLGLEMSSTYNKVNKYTEQGGNVSDYYLHKEEINYALDNPEKYTTITQITNYDNYLEYKDRIDDIRDNADNKKEATINYINSLKMSIPQKAMFIRLYYSSFDDYNEQIVNYINQNVSSMDEKILILTELGFTIEDGRVYW